MSTARTHVTDVEVYGYKKRYLPEKYYVSPYKGTTRILPESLILSLLLFFALKLYRYIVLSCIGQMSRKSSFTDDIPSLTTFR